MNQWELEANTRDRRQARENACDQVAIGFGFAPDWSSRWRELFKPITERSKAKPNQFRITLDTQLKTILMCCNHWSFMETLLASVNLPDNCSTVFLISSFSMSPVK